MPLAGDYLRRAAAEFVGVFALVFIAAGAVVYARTLTDIGLAYGLAVGVLATAMWHVSGAHFNPAVTLGFLVTRRIALPLAIVYWCTQFVAAIAASALLKWVLPSGAVDASSLGVPKLGQQVEAGHAVVIEAVLAFFLVWVFFAVTVDPRGTLGQIGGLLVGLTVTFDVLMAGALTGASLNPAKALGPMLLENQWSHWWVWFLGPFAGAAIAAVVYELLFLRPARPARPAATPPA
jgi:aquaporin Z